MEFPIQFPAAFSNSSPLPYLRTGPVPYVGPYPTTYLNCNPYLGGLAPVKASTASYFEDSMEADSCSDSNDLTMDLPPDQANDSGVSLSEDTETGLSGSSAKVKGCRKRKTFQPSRTLSQDDPDFRGVTVTMENRWVDKEWKLIVHSKFSLPPRKKRKFQAYVDSSDEEDINNNFTPVTEEKHCASCSVKKTPLWRDAEDGTPLCNACGIRYKKYKLRCGTCWHIPKKDEFRPTCQYCGSFYEYIYPRR